MSTETTAPQSWGRVLGAATLAALVVTLVVAAFTWPAATTTPQNLPVAITGPAPAIQTVEQQLETSAPGRFDLVEVADRDAAVAAVEQREVYGGLVLGEEPEVLTASAAGGASHQAMTRLADELGQVSADMPVTISDVVGLDADDAQGVGITAAAFPLVLGGMIGGIVVALLVGGRSRRLVAVGVYAVVAATLTTTVLHGWFGILPGDPLALTAGIGLSLLATSALIAGLASVLGPPGIGVGAAITLLIGNPISAASQPTEFLPWIWGDLGQLFVPGAAVTLVRSLAYFPDADLTQSLIVLGAWTLVGLALIVVGRRGDRPVSAGATSGTEPARELADA
ncbi:MULTISPECIES: hypothetical protein [Mumia]|uniref:hypothetical protein n=1 Tax=Mumia TaxID=1546255 RepID=UPI001421DC1C|nr:hypothetical protein [Mumia sp. ZJ430]